MVAVVVAPPLHHQTYTHTAADGVFRAWDVTRAHEIASDGREAYPFDLVAHSVTTERVEALYDGLDRTYALKTDLSRPILIIPFAGREFLIIDGWHRLWKAAYLGVAELPARWLSAEEAASVQWLELPAGHPLNPGSEQTKGGG